MSTAPQYRPHYTVEDYQHWDGDWELWNGTAVSMSPSPFGRHAQLLIGVGSELKQAIDANGCPASVLAEIDWIIADNTVLRPDLTVVCGDAPDKHVEAPPALVVEILAPSTRERDLTFKKAMSQEQKVPWYLIVDPETDSLQPLRLNANDEYELAPFSNTLSIDICQHCALEVKIDRLF